MRWYFTAAVAIFAVASLCSDIDSKLANSLGIQKTEEKKEVVLKEVHSAVEETATNDEQIKHLLQNSEHLAASKQGASPDAVGNSENEQRDEDARRSGSRRSRSRKNNYRNRERRRHRNNRYRSYKKKFHNQRNYYYLKKMIHPDMVQDVASLDDIITLDAVDDDWPKQRKKRSTNVQDADASCSDDDD